MDVDLAAVAALIADPSRAAMLDALLGGDARPARRAGRRAGVAPSTATGHLARLEAGGLVGASRVGRRRASGSPGPRSRGRSRRWPRSPRRSRRAACGLAARRGAARGALLLRPPRRRAPASALADALVGARRARARRRRLRDHRARASASWRRSASTCRDPAAPGGPPRAPAWTGPSAARTSPARSARRCWTSCCGVAGSSAGPRAARRA